MSSFAIECPVCGKYAEAHTGFFARKRIECSCGYVINVNTDKMATRKCEHCGNQVVYDQSKGDTALCPVCHEKINTINSMSSLVEISCPSCSCKLSTDKNAIRYTCPLCDTEIDVVARIAQEKAKSTGAASIIKYEGNNDTFIWKHPIEDFNMGSQLIVHESQEAILFKDGQALDLFGPGRHTLETAQMPYLEKIYALPTDTTLTFHTEVYFINKTVQMSIRWGTPDKVRFIDPLTGVPLQLGASGEMNIQVANSRKLLIKLVGTMSGISWEEGPGFTKSLQNSFRPLIANAVKTNLPTVIKNEAIDILEIDEKLDIISASLIEKIKPGFEDYGLTVCQFYVNNIVLPEEDPNFKRIRDLHTITLQTRMLQAEATVKTAKAQSETMYRTAEEQSKAAIEAARREAELQRQTTETEIARREAERKIIAAQADAQAQRMAGLTEAEIMAAKGYNQKDVIQAEVQKAYAEGIGNMGPAISAGGGSSIVGDMLGLGVGMAAASAIAPQIGGMFQNVGNIPQSSATPIQAPGSFAVWDCSCGNKNVNGNFCNICGNKKPAPAASASWDCTCGNKGIIGNFCSLCGSRRPVTDNGWDCTCGQKGIIGNFCNNCGARKPEAKPATWNCSCGKTGIIGSFCDNCGNKRGE